ncbi:DUF429 domain-containing protein [Paenibacillus sp. OV219]|uniref:DUF429 domain-containing protein n=1 Tax=Paenibacillus sp. OV219 TaxID=1884377 RepID=UPI0008AFF3B4|nr:DUF429 domain-containing protein [Paenibacillus sp. OV219]SEM51110.1 Predicted nuclease (RNAse H fold) [Paenibacillus sp. OV219]
MPRGIGIDGCRSGWAAVIMEDSPATTELLLAPNITELWALLQPERCEDILVFIDMPIGLPEGEQGNNNTHSLRISDADCRKLLPVKRKSSVFNTPTRQATYSGTPSETNFAIVQKKLSKQSENIIPKIREVDLFMKANLPYGIQHQMEESHPELNFQRFNGNMALTHNKKTKEGIVERSLILQNASIPAAVIESMLSHARANEVSKDDILDAAVLALAAYNISSGIRTKLKVSPSEQYDYAGELEMNISYC